LNTLFTKKMQASIDTRILKNWHEKRVLKRHPLFTYFYDG
jgi:hypothetical protein